MTSEPSQTPSTAGPPESDPGKNLGVYLNDHLAGSTGGLQLASDMAERHKDDELGPFLQQLVQDIGEDREALLSAMVTLGVEKNPIKQGVAWAGEKLGRLKLGDSPTSAEAANDLLEFETMSLGVEGKRCGWVALQRAGISGGLDLPRLIERAETQRDGLEQHRLQLAARALA
jgi:hypothetical protein